MKRTSHEISIRGLARKLAAYHARMLLIDLSIQGLSNRVDRALRELETQGGFLNKLTEHKSAGAPSPPKVVL